MMTAPKKISIIMPAYNAEKTIERAVRSVLFQSYKHWELFIINDGSVDSTDLVLKQFESLESVKIVNLTINRGVSYARNVGLSVVSGDYICFLDSDDWWEPFKLDYQVSYLNAGHNIVFSPHYRVNDAGQRYILPVKRFVRESDFRYYNPIPNATGIFSKLLLPIEQKNIKHEDYLMWFQLVKKAGYAISTAECFPVSYYSVNKNSISSDKIKSATWHWQILTLEFGFNKMIAVFYMLTYTLNAFRRRLFKKNS